MLMHPYYGRVKRFIFSPKQAFKNEMKMDLGTSFRFMLPLFIFSSITMTVVSTVIFSTILPELIPMTVLGVVSGMVSSFVSGIMGALVMGVWLHLWLYIMGARKGIERTIEVAFYSSIPALLLTWVPMIGISFMRTNFWLALSIILGGFGVLMIWNLYLVVVGAKMYHKMKGSKVGLAIILSIIIPLLIIAAAVIFAIGFFSAIAA